MSTKVAKIFQDFFFERFPWRGRKQLQNLLNISRQSDEIFPLDFRKKKQIVNFAEKKFFSESFLWKRESSFDKDAEIFIRKPREIFGQCPKKIGRITFQKKFSQSFSLELQISFLITPPSFSLTRFWKKIQFLSKNNGKVFVSEDIFFPKVFLWTRRMQFQQTRQKTRQGPKISAQCLKMIKNFICFPKQFFFKKCFDRYGESSFDTPAKLFLLNYRNWSEKSRQKCKNFSNFFSAKCSYGELKSSLKAPLTSFSTFGRNFSARFSKINIL